MAIKLRLDIQSKKFMSTFMWNPSGFCVVDRLLNDAKMNNDYFVTKALNPLEQAIILRGRAPHQRKFVLHFANCLVDTSRDSIDWLEEYGMDRMPRQSYSSDLAPSYFYLFPSVKEKLERIHVTDED
jgi:hypothetical protein